MRRYGIGKVVGFSGALLAAGVFPGMTWGGRQEDDFGTHRPRRLHVLRISLRGWGVEQAFGGLGIRFEETRIPIMGPADPQERNHEGERHFRDPDRYSLRREYYPDGTLKAERFYKNHVLEGEAREYDEEGRLREIAVYRGGLLVRRRRLPSGGTAASSRILRKNNNEVVGGVRMRQQRKKPGNSPEGKE